MNLIRIFVVLLSLMFSAGAFAGDQTLFEIKRDFVQQLEKDNVITADQSKVISDKYVTDADKEIIMSEEGLVSKYANWQNFLKVVGIALLLVAFHGIIGNIIRGLWSIISAVPLFIYQGAALAACVVGLVAPELYWASQAFYIALFSSVATLMVIGWICATYPSLIVMLERFFSLGIPVGSLASFYGMIYFGVLAVAYQSQLFGFAAAICLSGIFTFGLVYLPHFGALVLDFKEDWMKSIIVSHLIVLGAYMGLHDQHIQYIELFSKGLQYYTSIALGVALLVAASPFYKRSSAVPYAFLFTVVVSIAMYGYFFWNLQVIGSIMACFFVLFFLEWLAYLSFTGGVIFGCLVTGASLYALSFAFDATKPMLVFAN